jgi:hypothetical protein
MHYSIRARMSSESTWVWLALVNQAGELSLLRFEFPRHPYIRTQMHFWQLHSRDLLASCGLLGTSRRELFALDMEAATRKKSDSLAAGWARSNRCVDRVPCQQVHCRFACSAHRCLEMNKGVLSGLRALALNGLINSSHLR